MAKNRRNRTRVMNRSTIRPTAKNTVYFTSNHDGRGSGAWGTFTSEMMS
jgi:hypothetical protein